MKIAIITEILSTHSGSRAPIDLAESLSSSNDVTLLAYDDEADPKLKKYLENKKIHIVLIKPYSFLLGKYLTALKFLPHIKKCDLVSFHGTLSTFLAAKISRRPLIRTYYGTQLHAYLEKLLPCQKPNLKDKFLNWLVNRYLLFIQTIMFSLSDQSVGISQFTRLEAKKLFGQKIPFFYLGSGLPSAHPKLPMTNSQPPITTILSVSRLTPYKGFHLLIEAFKKVNKKIPNLKLVLVGSAPNLRYLIYLRNLSKNQKNVQILTDISDQELSRLYQRCDLYATCDKYLFFGLPIVEAAKYAKPAVALNEAAASELIDHNQSGFVAQNLDELTFYLQKLIKNPKIRNKFGLNAQRKAHQLFHWPKIAQKYEKLFQKFLIYKKNKFPLKTPLMMALIISFIFGLPHLLTPIYLGGFENYQPLVVNQVPLTTFEETFVYAAQAREVCDGHPFSADAQLAEYKNIRSFFPLPSLIAGGFGCLIGSIPAVFMIADFLLPPVIFLIVYLFLIKTIANQLMSILGGVLLLTADRLFLFFPPLTLDMAKAFWNILTIQGTETVAFEFSRYPYPQLAFLILALYLYFLFLALKEKKLTMVLLSALFLGLLFYTYFYYWTFALASGAILSLFLMSQRKIKELKLLLKIFSAALVLSLPHWFLFFQFQALPFSKDIMERMGLELGHFRNIYRSAEYLLLALIFFLFTKKKDFTLIFFTSFLLGGVVCLNLQLLTGYTLQSWHWTLRAINPLVIIMLVYLGYQLVSRKFLILNGFGKQIFSSVILSLTFVLLLRALILQIVVIKNSYQGFTLPKTTLEAFTWLEKNTAKDSTVVTPSFETNSLIPAYTHNNIFLPHGNVTIAPNKEITDRLLITYRIFNLSKQSLAQVLSYRGDGLGDCYQDHCLVKFEYWEKQAIIELYYYKYLHKQEGLLSWKTYYEMPKEEQQQILKNYERLLETPDLDFPKYQIDYLYYGPAEKKFATIDFNQYLWTKKVYQNADVQIYKIEK